MRSYFKQARMRGFTLAETLLLVALLSIFTILYATSEPLISEERQAALTISRTYDLLRGAHAYHNANNFNWPTLSELNAFLPSRNNQSQNAFGQAYYRQIYDGQFLLFQLVPKQWAYYIENHLEQTAVLELSVAQSGPLGAESGLATLYDRGYVGIRSAINRYGNLPFGFVRRQFESSAEVLNKNDRKSPENGRTRAMIPKPYCGDGSQGNTLQPVISYTVRGACSFYPRYYSDNDVAKELADKDSTKNLDESYWYTTQGFRTQLSSETISGQDVWFIDLQSHERWYKVQTVTTTDPDGTEQTDKEFIPMSTWSASQEFCGVKYNDVYKNQNLDKQNDPTISNSDFFDEDHLLYVDAWVNCE